MDFDAIMTEITSGLTDDPEKDIKYLMEQSLSVFRKKR